MVALNDYPNSGAEDLAMACESVVKLLINRGAKIDLQDNDEETALMKAVMYKKLNIIKMLLEAGANPNIFDKYNRNALCYLYIFHDKDLILISQIFKLLILYGADYHMECTALDNELKKEDETINFYKLKIPFIKIFKEVYDEKLNPLRIIFNNLVKSLDLVVTLQDKKIILEYPNLKLDKEPKEILNGPVTIQKFDTIKSHYEWEKKDLEKKIQYLFDTVELYPGGKKFNELKEDFQSRLKN